MAPRTIWDFGFWGIASSLCFVTSLPLRLPPVWLYTTSPMDLSVVLGTNDLRSPSLEVKRVTSIILHKDFQRVNMDNDIALLLLALPITFSGLKEPICLPRKLSPSMWHKCWVAGWGQTNTGT